MVVISLFRHPQGTVRHLQLQLNKQAEVKEQKQPPKKTIFGGKLNYTNLKADKIILLEVE